MSGRRPRPSGVTAKPRARRVRTKNARPVPSRVSRPSHSRAEALERAEKILAKELRNRDGIDFANVNVNELHAIQELLRDARQYGGPVLGGAEAILRDMKDWDGRLCTREKDYAFADVPALRTVHELVLDARKSVEVAGTAARVIRGGKRRRPPDEPEHAQ